MSTQNVHRLAYLATVNLVDSPMCIQCGKYEEDLNHVLWQCPFHKLHRSTLINKLNKLKVSFPLNIDNVLYYPKSQICTNHLFSRLMS